MRSFKNYLTEEIEVGQAFDAHEPTERASSSLNNPTVMAKVNLHIFTELNEVFLSPEAGFQKIRKVLHTFGLDMPALYDMDQDGDELVLDVAQFGDEKFGSALLYVLYYLTDNGYFEFYAELADEERIEELLESGLEEEEEDEEK